MTIFFFTMNMHARSGTPTHMVVGTVKGVRTISEMHELLDQSDFITVEEYYRAGETSPKRDTVTSPDGTEYYSVGETIINVMYIGKVKL